MRLRIHHEESKVLITGGLGFIGSSCAVQQLDRCIFAVAELLHA